MRQQPLLRNIWFTDAGGESGRNFTEKKKRIFRIEPGENSIFCTAKSYKENVWESRKCFCQRPTKKKIVVQKSFFHPPSPPQEQIDRP